MLKFSVTLLPSILDVAVKGLLLLLVIPAAEAVSRVLLREILLSRCLVGLDLHQDAT